MDIQTGDRHTRNATDSEEFEDEDTTSEDLDSSENTINGVGNIRPLISGNHELSFVIEWDNEVYLATETLSVVSGSVYGLDLQLSDIAIQAGEIINYEVVAVDRFGNNVELLDVDVVSDDINVQLDETQITSTTFVSIPCQQLSKKVMWMGLSFQHQTLSSFKYNQTCR